MRHMHKEETLIYTADPLPVTATTVTLKIFSEEHQLKAGTSTLKRLQEGLISFDWESFHLAFIPLAEPSEHHAFILPDRTLWDLYLLIMPFTVHPPSGEKYYQDVRFYIDVSLSSAKAFDFLPHTMFTVEEISKHYFFPPNIEVQFPDVRPVVISSGKGESLFYWTFQPSPSQSALVPGTKHALAILQLPTGTPFLQGTIYYEATIVKPRYDSTITKGTKTDQVPFSRQLIRPSVSKNAQRRLNATMSPQPIDFFIRSTPSVSSTLEQRQQNKSSGIRSAVMLTALGLEY